MRGEERERGASFLKRIFADFALEVGLPVVSGFDVKAGEVAAAANIGIDTNGMSQIEREV